MSEYVIVPKEKIVAMADKVRENDEALTIDDIAEKIGSDGGEILKFFGCENYEILPLQKDSVGTAYVCTESGVLVSNIKFLCLISNSYLLGTSATMPESSESETMLAVFMINLNGFTKTINLLNNNKYTIANSIGPFNHQYSKCQIEFDESVATSYANYYGYAAYDDTQGYTCLLMY